MTTPKIFSPKPGDLVAIKSVPAGLLDNLPNEDRNAILKASTSTMRLVEYDELGRAELEFTDDQGAIHFIYVSRDLLTSVG